MAGIKVKSARWFSAGIVLTVAVFATLFSLWTPPAFDDFTFMAEWRDVNGTAPLSISTLFDFWKDIRLYDNGRIANLLSPLSTLFSPYRELFSPLTGIMTGLMLCIAVLFSFPSRNLSPLRLALVWGAMLFLLPWRNSLFVADYSLNYIWGGAVTLVFICTVLHFERKGWTVPALVTALLLAFVAGGWHEGFAAATLCGFLLLTFVRRCRFSTQWYVIGTFYAIVTILFYLCPGMLSRTSLELAAPSAGLNTFKIFADFLPVILLIAITLVEAIVPAWRQLLSEAWQSRVFILGWGIGAAGVTLSLLFRHQPRSAFWPDLMAIVMLFRLLTPVWRGIARSRFRGYVTSLVFLLSLLPMVSALAAQFSFFEESKQILSEIEASEYGTVYRDIIPSGSLSPLSLKMPSHNLWVTPYQYQALGNHTGKPLPAVVPKELGNPDILSAALPLEGDAGAFMAGHSILLPYALKAPEVVEVEAMLGDGSTTCAAAMALPFRLPGGNRATYIAPYGIPPEDIAGLNLIK